MLHQFVDGISESRGPIEPDIATVYKTDVAKYYDTAREWTRKYAMCPKEPSRRIQEPYLDHEK